MFVCVNMLLMFAVFVTSLEIVTTFHSIPLSVVGSLQRMDSLYKFTHGQINKYWSGSVCAKLQIQVIIPLLSLDPLSAADNLKELRRNPYNTFCGRKRQIQTDEYNVPTSVHYCLWPCRSPSISPSLSLSWFASPQWRHSCRATSWAKQNPSLLGEEVERREEGGGGPVSAWLACAASACVTLSPVYVHIQISPLLPLPEQHQCTWDRFFLQSWTWLCADTFSPVNKSHDMTASSCNNHHRWRLKPNTSRIFFIGFPVFKRVGDQIFEL